MKVRVWDKNLKKFLSKEWYGLDLDGKLFSVTVIDSESVRLCAEPPQNYVIQRFTGLLDKHGKEIYEGDIFNNFNVDETYTSPCVVVWSKYEEVGWACAMSLDRLYVRPADLTPLEHVVNGIKLYEEYPLVHHGLYEVIGNIFENESLIV